MFSPFLYFAVYFGKIFVFQIMCLTKLRLYFRIHIVTYVSHICYTSSNLSKFADYAGCLFIILFFDDLLSSFALRSLSLSIFLKALFSLFIGLHEIPIMYFSFHYLTSFIYSLKVSKSFRVIRISE